MPRSDATVYIVDDDASVREALAWLLRSRRLLSEAFASADAFEQALGSVEPGAPGCVLLDVRMPGASGLALFDRLVERGTAHAWPVIFLTGHANVATAVEMLKRGAFDFCEKPFSDNALVDRVELALALSRERLTQLAVQRALRARMDELTERERDVLRLVASGRPNKLIADELGISVRTVEVHRARVFEKMDVRSAVELSQALQKVQP
ncbi:response regulator transcription factor [Ottowia testudinis]|uniref:Response regulator transcription factor n=1 Tax=Ottowia testudinis TaxID=2816950 RepID=A0A975H374_9BURK|nr:response regulator [Ottowia testudinis]QTD45603.1 response regulator transcription factor [Ottowia testudinis]